MEKLQIGFEDGDGWWYRSGAAFGGGWATEAEARAEGAKAIVELSDMRHSILAAKGPMTVYALTQLAQAHCPKLTETAVAEYLSGKRDMQASRVEALMRALNLKITK